MSTIIDILLIIFIALGTYAGWRRGLIKSLVNLVGLVAVVIISYSLRIPIANFLIDKLPFFSFGGLTALNILIYNVLSFVFAFIMLYCILNIIITITGFIDTLLKFTVIWIIPSKIGGAIVGFFESWVFVFLVLFVLASFNVSASWVIGGKVSNFVLDHTPVIGGYLGGITFSAREIYQAIDEAGKVEEKDVKNLNFKILSTLVSYDILSDKKAQELIEIGKLDLSNYSIIRPTMG